MHALISVCVHACVCMQAELLVADANTTLTVSGNGDVLEPQDGLMGEPCHTSCIMPLYCSCTALMNEAGTEVYVAAVCACVVCVGWGCKGCNLIV